MMINQVVLMLHNGLNNLKRNNMKQTAIEWLVEQFNTTINYTLEEYQLKIEQAKQMEKEQIKDAWFDGVTNWDSEKEVEDYIKETFKSK